MKCILDNILRPICIIYTARREHLQIIRSISVLLGPFHDHLLQISPALSIITLKVNPAIPRNRYAAIAEHVTATTAEDS